MKIRGGCIFQPRYTRDGVLRTSPVWMLQYWQHGKRVRESSKTTERKQAQRMLVERLKVIGEGGALNPKADQVRVGELLERLVAEYEVNRRRSLRRLKGALAHVRAFFGHMKALEVTPTDVDQYVSKRRIGGAANATINRELTALRRAFNLAVQREELPRVPRIGNLQEDNVRQGFFEPHQYEAVLEHLPADLRPVAIFAYITGWRVHAEILPMQWGQVDFKGGVVRLEPGTTKNREGRTFPLTPELQGILEAQGREAMRLLTDRGIKCLYVFHRGGKPIKSFRRAWATACRKAGVPGRIPHDFRRTAIRSMIRAGIPERVAMQLSGHKTRSVFDRYNIVSEGDLREAARRLATVRDQVRTDHSIAVTTRGPVAQADRAEVS